MTGDPTGRARGRPERLKALAQALQLFCATVFCINLLLRDHVPLPLSVVLAQSSVALAAYLCLLGAREYMGRAPLGLALPLWPWRFCWRLPCSLPW